MCLLLLNPYPTSRVQTSIFSSHGYGGVVIMLHQCCHGDTVAALSVRKWTNEGLCKESRKQALIRAQDSPVSTSAWSQWS